MIVQLLIVGDSSPNALLQNFQRVLIAPLLYGSTTGGVRAVHVSTAKFIHKINVLVLFCPY